MNTFKTIAGLLFLLIFASCTPSADDVYNKIKAKQELTTKDYTVMINYLNEMMNDPEFGSIDFHKIAENKYQYWIRFCQRLNRAQNDEVITLVNDFMDKSIDSGKGKYYTASPIYYMIEIENEVSDKELALITDYVEKGLTSGYKGDELTKHFPYLEMFMINWTNCGDDRLKNAIHKGLDNAIQIRLNREQL